MNIDINKLLEKHELWLNTEGRVGKQLSLYGFAMASLSEKKRRLLIDSFLADCSFDNMELNDIDLYRSEMHSCQFKDIRISKVSFAKCDINITSFNNASVNNSSFHNAELYECAFRSCKLIDVSFAGVSIWKTSFENCIFQNVNFEDAMLSELMMTNTTLINPQNLEKACEITLNVGITDSPVILSKQDSIAWIKAHSQS